MYVYVYIHICIFAAMYTVRCTVIYIFHMFKNIDINNTYARVCRELVSFPELNLFCILFQVFCAGFPTKFNMRGSMFLRDSSWGRNDTVCLGTTTEKTWCCKRSDCNDANTDLFFLLVFAVIS